MARDYARENANYKSKPAQIEKRVGRNQARAIMEKAVGKTALKGKEVDHKNDNPTDNRRSNLRVVTPRANNNGRAGGAATMKGKR